MTTEAYFKDWLKVIDINELNVVIKKLNILYNKGNITPLYKDIFKAFTLCSEKDCKIVFLGQDPYPQKDVATGVLFGNKLNTLKLSPSLQVLKECVLSCESDSTPFISFDSTLESWARQGILMLNSALTCEVNNIGSHTSLWWPFMKSLICNLNKVETGLIYVLFGNQAILFEPYINKKFNDVIIEKHPSYYARTNTNMPKNVFYKINDLMMTKYGTQIQWYLEQ